MLRGDAAFRMHYDAIVVGAGPAGCAAAYDLAAAGRDVLVFDRRQFPRVKPCAGGITVKTARLLRYTIAPVVRQVCSDVVVGRRLETSIHLEGRHALCAMTVRADFDDFCLRRTVERGAHFRVISHIDALTEDAGGVTVDTAGGALRARYVIGADGANSVVRRLLPGPDSVSLGFALEAQVRTERAPPMTFDFGIVEHGYGWLFPKADHVNVGLYTNSPALRPGRKALEEYARAKLGAASLEHVVGHHIGLGGGTTAPAAARVVLAGDAAGLVDPLLGEGIHNAVASGQAAAAAIADADATGETLAAAYTRRMRAIRSDLRASYRAAVSFYGNIELGYRVLTTPIARFALLNGYARGLTFSALARRFPLFPLLRIPSTPIG